MLLLRWIHYNPNEASAYHRPHWIAIISKRRNTPPGSGPERNDDSTLSNEYLPIKATER